MLSQLRVHKCPVAQRGDVDNAFCVWIFMVIVSLVLPSSSLCLRTYIPYARRLLEDGLLLSIVLTMFSNGGKITRYSRALSCGKYTSG
jgi:hypothetical protein